jgi:3-keto-5-aminohexanoate cleavage enzyme
MEPVLISVAPNGARRGKADHPAIPLALPEIVAEARSCHQAGAAMLHLHVRDDQGRHSLDAGRYCEALDELGRQAPGMLVQITTEAGDRYAPDAQFDCLKMVRPAFASVSVREISRDLAVVARLYHLAAETGIAIQHILYDTEDLLMLQEWTRDGLVPPVTAQSLIFVLGRYATGQVAHPRDLLPFLSVLPPTAVWSVCAFGQREAACAAVAMAFGGHVRVGFENNLHLPDGRLASGNADLVEQAVVAAHLMGRSPADAKAARRILAPAAQNLGSLHEKGYRT